MNIQAAKRIPLTDYLAGLGFYPVKRRGPDLWYLSPLRTETRASFKVNRKLNTWYDFGIGRGGNILALSAEFYRTENISRQLQHIAANRVITDPTINDTLTQPPGLKLRKIGQLAHPGLVGYLRQRRIDPIVAQIHCREIHYTIHGRIYFAIGFANNSGGYELRNRYFKGALPPKDITWIRQANPKTACRLFEGFTDYLSYLTMHGVVENEDFLILNSASLLTRATDPLKSYERVHCCLDHDSTGKRLLNDLKTSLGDRVFDDSGFYTGYKDLNAYLCAGNNG